MSTTLCYHLCQPDEALPTPHLPHISQGAPSFTLQNLLTRSEAHLTTGSLKEGRILSLQRVCIFLGIEERAQQLEGLGQDVLDERIKG